MFYLGGCFLRSRRAHLRDFALQFFVLVGQLNTAEFLFGVHVPCVGQLFVQRPYFVFKIVIGSDLPGVKPGRNQE